MAQTFNIVVLLALSCAFLQSADALKCFGDDGTDINNITPGGPGQNESTTCHANATKCAIRTQTVAGPTPIVSLVKSCLFPEDQGFCNQTTSSGGSSGGTTVVMCCCTKDNCNESAETCKAANAPDTAPEPTTTAKPTSSSVRAYAMNFAGMVLMSIVGAVLVH
jgi:hypothetical protein